LAACYDLVMGMWDFRIEIGIDEIALRWVTLDQDLVAGDRQLRHHEVPVLVEPDAGLTQFAV